MRGKVFSQVNLQSQSFPLASKYFFCCKEVKHTEHLFLSCSFISKLWLHFYFSSSAKNNLIFPFGERLLKWKSWGSSEQGVLLRELFPLAICWVIWNERNTRCFEEKGASLKKMVIEVKNCVWLWNSEWDSMKNLKLEKLIFDWDNL